MAYYYPPAVIPPDFPWPYPWESDETWQMGPPPLPYPDPSMPAPPPIPHLGGPILGGVEGPVPWPAPSGGPVYGPPPVPNGPVLGGVEDGHNPFPGQAGARPPLLSTPWGVTTEGWRDWRPSALGDDPQAWREALGQGDGDAWNGYAAGWYNAMLPYLGVDDFSAGEEMLRAYDPSFADYDPGQRRDEGGNLASIREDDRRFLTGGRWNAIAKGMELGRSLLADTKDPDEKKYDPAERAQNFLGRVTELGQKHALPNTEKGYGRQALLERNRDWAAVKGAYGDLDPRFLALGESLFNPSQRGMPDSPMAYKSGRYSGGEPVTSGYGSKWAYRNPTLT